MYDEQIQRSSRRLGIQPIDFEHPRESRIIDCFQGEGAASASVVLTGTAGDGKTHLCRKVWEHLGGAVETWAGDEPLLRLDRSGGTLFVLRDLSGWASQDRDAMNADDMAFFRRFCSHIFNPISNEAYLIAANDGQLLETLRGLPQEPEVVNARRLFDELLVDDKETKDGLSLRFFNLSRISSEELYRRCIDAFIRHPGWEVCYAQPEPGGLFSELCPIRRNFEVLRDEQFQQRLGELFQLCDHIGTHVPVRQILLLFVNALLGHADDKEGLLSPEDVKHVVANNTVAKASIYSNVFGGNLRSSKREHYEIFRILNQFQIGYETTNRLDEIILFGEDDIRLGRHYFNLIGADPFYGSDAEFREQRRHYIEEGDENTADFERRFTDILIRQRRGMFFRATPEIFKELRLWSLSVFQYAGEYLGEVVGPLSKGAQVRKAILARLVKGLNRIFTGMLSEDNELLFLATGASCSQASISRVLVERVDLSSSFGQRIFLSADPESRKVYLNIQFDAKVVERVHMNLTRFEFLSRVAEDGALPASFSKECYEDILALKSLLINTWRSAFVDGPGERTLRVLSLADNGLLQAHSIEVNLP